MSDGGSPLETEWPAPDTTAVMKLHVEPRRSLVDEPLRIKLTGLDPGQPLTLRARQIDDYARAWRSHADFTADARGNVDVTSQPARSGTYTGADGMGLVWSMGLDPDEQDRAPFFRKESSMLPMDVIAEIDGTFVAQERVERLYGADGVDRVVVREDGLVATLFVPPGPGPHPVVITLSGSGGGLFEGGAALYASHGYDGLALAYFNAESLPSELIDIPLEYFESAIHWLERQPHLDAERIAVSGTSRGGELALLLVPHSRRSRQ